MLTNLTLYFNWSLSFLSLTPVGHACIRRQSTDKQWHIIICFIIFQKNFCKKLYEMILVNQSTHIYFETFILEKRAKDMNFPFFRNLLVRWSAETKEHEKKIIHLLPLLKQKKHPSFWIICHLRGFSGNPTEHRSRIWALYHFWKPYRALT